MQIFFSHNQHTFSSECLALNDFFLSGPCWQSNTLVPIILNGTPSNGILSSLKQTFLCLAKGSVSQKQGKSVLCLLGLYSSSPEAPGDLLLLFGKKAILVFAQNYYAGQPECQRVSVLGSPNFFSQSIALFIIILIVIWYATYTTVKPMYYMHPLQIVLSQPQI